jgi:hypothetical protein
MIAPPLTSTQKHVLKILYDYADENLISTVPVDTIADETGFCKRTVLRALKFFRENGWIERYPVFSPLGRMSNRYRLLGKLPHYQPQVLIDTPSSEIDRQSIRQLLKPRADGYLHATLMCKAYDKLFADWYRLKSTKTLTEALSFDMGIPISNLIQSVRGGNITKQGTYIHPDLAVQLAQWLDPTFALFVSRLVRAHYAASSPSTSYGANELVDVHYVDTQPHSPTPREHVNVNQELVNLLTVIEANRTFEQENRAKEAAQLQSVCLTLLGDGPA